MTYLKTKVTFPILFLLVTACSTVKIGYNNADWLLPWYIGNYFNLNAIQKEFVKEKVAYHLEWHRYNELPRYVRFINDAAPKITDGLTAEEYDWILAEIRSSYVKLAERILVDAAEILIRLSPEQIDDLQEKFFERAADFEKRSKRTEEERIKLKQERTIERMEDWFGNLTEDQVILINELVRSLPDNSDLYKNDQRRRQKEFISLLRDKPNREIFTERLRLYFTDYNHGRPQHDAKLSEDYQQASKQMSLKIDAILSKEQKMRALDKIRAYEIDFKELASMD